jgi:hypothetical protein
MDRALAGQPAVALPGASAAMLDGVQRPVPDLLTECVDEKKAQYAINDAGFTYEASPQPIFTSKCPVGTVGAQSPAAGTMMSPGATVVYYMATDQYPGWWYNWPPTWDPNVPPSDWWGGAWPPPEWNTNPPNGWDPDSWGDDDEDDDDGGGGGGG